MGASSCFVAAQLICAGLGQPFAGKKNFQPNMRHDLDQHKGFRISPVQIALSIISLQTDLRDFQKVYPMLPGPRFVYYC